VNLIANLARVVATKKGKGATTLSMAKIKAIIKTKTNAVDTAEVPPVKVWDPKWENSNQETTKIATTMSNVPLTQHGAKLRMRWYLSSNQKRSKT
jgi:hypothetical protein